MSFTPREELATGSGGRVRLRSCLTSGGREGGIWSVDRAGVVAKLYHSAPSPQTAAKLRWMAAHPLHGATSGSGRPVVAWPIDTLLRGGLVAGFLMPQVDSGWGLSTLVNDGLRLTDAPQLTWRDLLAIGLNLAHAFQVVHGNRAVVGDVRDENVLVVRDNTVTLIDVDSFQVFDPRTKTTYLCEVGDEAYQSPQVLQEVGRQGGSFKVLRRPSDDRFGLAVLLHQLLLGAHPFYGEWVGPPATPDLRRFILEHHYIHRPGSLMRPLPTRAPLSSLPPELRDLFARCFLDGHAQPDKRPTAEEWRIALAAAFGKVGPCATYPTRHYYHPSAGRCPWCSLVGLGVDLFGTAPRRSAAPPPPVPAAVPAPFRTRASPAPSRAPTRRGRRRLFAAVAAVVLLAAAGIGYRAATRDRSAGAAAAAAAPSPAVRGVSPADGQLRVGAPFAVEVDATTATGTALVQYRAGDGEWAPADGRRVTVTPRQAGTLEVQFRATDGSGRSSEPVTKSWPVTENKRPAVAVADTGPVWPIPGGAWRARVRVTDEVPGACRLRYRLVGETDTVELPAGATEVTLRNLPSGARGLTVWAVDDLGAESEPVEVPVPVAAVKPIALPAVPFPQIRNAVGMSFVTVPAGEFAMGAPDGEADGADAERPVHGVRFGRPFLLGKCEVTSREWRAVMGPAGAVSSGEGEFPRTGVTVEQAEEFCRVLSGLREERAAGRTYRIPNEAEWEYACRAGTTTAFHTGAALDKTQARFELNSKPGGVGPVRQFPANRFGLFDMHGNAPELCYSRGDYWVAPVDGGSATPAVVYRGGGGEAPAASCRSAARSFDRPKDVGLRVVCEEVAPLTGSDLFFNHADLRGWNVEGEWAVRQGVLTGRTDGKEIGLYSFDNYANFRLSFAVKVGSHAAFGVRVRSSRRTAGPVFLFPGGGYTEDYGFGAGARKVPWGSTRDLPDYKWVNPPAEPAAVAKAVRQGEYNVVVLTVTGGNATVKVNGLTLTPVAFGPGKDEATRLRPTGPIGFLLSGTGEANIKDVVLESLP